MTDGIYAAVVAAFLLVLLAAWTYADWARRDRERREARRESLCVEACDLWFTATCPTCGLPDSDSLGSDCQCWRDEPTEWERENRALLA